MSFAAFIRHPALRAALIALLPLAAQADSYTLVARIEGSVTSLSADGQAAAGVTLDTFETFLWTARQGRTLLGRNTWTAFNRTSGTPRISADGRVVSATIVSDDGTRGTAGRWTRAGGWKPLAPPLPADGGVVDQEDSSAFGLSADGQVVTGLYWRPANGSARAMAWTAATGMTGLSGEGRASRIDAASATGHVLGGWDEHPSYGNRRATVWERGTRTVLEPSDWPSEVSALNPAGTLAVGYSGNPEDYQTYATLWRRGPSGWAATRLGVFTRRGSTGMAFATGLSADAGVVVGSARPDFMSPKSVGFIWTPEGGFQDAGEVLKAAGVPLQALHPVIGVGAVSADGRTLAVVTQGLRAPWPTRTLLVRRTPSAVAP